MCDRDKIRAEAFREAAALVQSKAGFIHYANAKALRYVPPINEAARLDALAHEIRMLAGPSYRPSYFTADR